MSLSSTNRVALSKFGIFCSQFFDSMLLIVQIKMPLHWTEAMQSDAKQPKFDVIDYLQKVLNLSQTA